ncbi:MAG: hypothetical protein HC842_05620 [Cytophagales bacterium]|nr:hypothetical protein [Cytophagales bacterium]
MKQALLTFYAMALCMASAFAQSKMDSLARAQWDELKSSSSLSGGLSINTMYTQSTVPSQTRPPWFYMLTGNLTATLGPLVLPFSASISSQDRDYTYPQPFNQFGLSPKYKYVTLHLGYRSLNFSEFTLGGTLFYGIGLEVLPPRSFVKGSVMYGRLGTALTRTDSLGRLLQPPVYDRYGYGAKLTLGRDKHQADLIFLSAWDDPQSISQAYVGAEGATPGENLVVGLSARNQWADKINTEITYALSAYTRDRQLPEEVLPSYTYLNNLGSLFTPNPSSKYNGAFNGRLNYSGERAQYNLSYRRIGPEYQSMGAVFLTNDLEDITGGVGWTMWQNKLALHLSAGLQYNNLDGQQLSQNERTVGSAGVNYTANEHWNFGLNVANFNSSSELTSFTRQSFDGNPDSLFFLQVNSNATLNAGYQTSRNDKNHSVNSVLSYQETYDNQGNSSNFYKIEISYFDKIAFF